MQKLTKDQYYSLNATILFSEIDSNTTGCYGCVTFGSKTYKFSWHSSLIEPQIEYFKDGVVGIGIDQHFCLLNYISGEHKAFSLFTFFLFMKAFGNLLFVICETEIIVIDIKYFIQYRDLVFDEIIKDINVNDQYLIVSFIDDRETEINLNNENGYCLLQ